jgi:hypothetical protein
MTPTKRKVSEAPSAAVDDDDDDTAPDAAAGDFAPAPSPEPNRTRLSAAQAVTPLSLAVAPPTPAVAPFDGDCVELVAFLRRLSPPLADIERVAAAAAASGLQLSELREAMSAPAHLVASTVQLVADLLEIRRGVDKLTLMRALQRPA